MTDAELWRLTWEIAVLAGIFASSSYIWLRKESRRLNREFGERHTPGE